MLPVLKKYTYCINKNDNNYASSFENWLEVALLSLTAVLLFYGHVECHVEAKRQVRLEIQL
jgi:hypothetical protein